MNTRDNIINQIITHFPNNNVFTVDNRALTTGNDYPMYEGKQRSYSF